MTRVATAERVVTQQTETSVDAIARGWAGGSHTVTKPRAMDAVAPSVTGLQTIKPSTKGIAQRRKESARLMLKKIADIISGLKGIEPSTMGIAAQRAYGALDAASDDVKEVVKALNAALESMKKEGSEPTAAQHEAIHTATATAINNMRGMRLKINSKGIEQEERDAHHQRELRKSLAKAAAADQAITAYVASGAVKGQSIDEYLDGPSRDMTMDEYLNGPSKAVSMDEYLRGDALDSINDVLGLEANEQECEPQAISGEAVDALLKALDVINKFITVCNNEMASGTGTNNDETRDTVEAMFRTIFRLGLMHRFLSPVAYQAAPEEEIESDATQAEQPQADLDAAINAVVEAALSNLSPLNNIQ